MPTTRCAAFALATLAAPALALAAEGEKSGGYIGPFADIGAGVPSAITAIVVFGIVLFILSAAVWPKIQSGLSDREQKIKGEIAAAEAARAQAKAALDEYEKSLAEARAEAQRMLEQTKAQQTQLAAELRAKSEAELAAMKQRATADIEAAKKAALAEIYQQSVTLATAMAAKILKREVNPGDQDRLIQESMTELAAARQN